MKTYQRVCAEIDLNSFEHNLNQISNLLKPNTQVIAVIKTDGYGHGAIPLGRILELREEIWGYAVATVEEAIILRDSGLKKPILILGYVFPEDYLSIVDNDIRPAVFTYEMAKTLSDIGVQLNRDVHIHIKLDTGMSRIGFQVTKQAAEIIAQINELPHIVIEGMFSHYAKADEIDKAFTVKQTSLYDQMAEWLKEKGVQPTFLHISNSAGIIDLPEYNKNLVRAGIILYGLWPSSEVIKSRIQLKPILSLKSHVVHIKKLDAGRTISYGGTYQVRTPRIIATVPVGYGDGYPRSLSNKGYVLVNGKKASICGRVCMDQFMIDITDIPEVNVGSEVVLIGKSGEETITMEMLGELSDRFNYEFACDLGKRIPRVYMKDDVRVAVMERDTVTFEK